MTQLTQIGTHATVVLQVEDHTSIIYRGTKVVRFNNNEIVLNTDGWQTSTTKRRMNQASGQFGLGYHVYQDKGIWYVDYKDKTLEFSDNMILCR